ncbi:MAG: alginate export family protein [Candidatus Solibacter sp.]
MPCSAQEWDVLGNAAAGLSNATDKKLTLSFEQKGRYEIRTGTNFGADPDVATGLIRTRVGLNFTPASWLKLSGMAQDSRAPWYGENAPNNVRDPFDWHEGYIELFPAHKTGFGLNVGRMMLNYGEGRLIGTPQWGNLARTYDQARVYWRSPRMRLEFLAVSPVKVRIGEFNHPVLGDRVWGTYNSFPNFYKTELLEFYVLRRDQNHPGGFNGGSSKDGTDKIGINTYGFRLAGPIGDGVKYSLEAALQRGKVGPAHLAAEGWFASLSRRWTLAGRPLDILMEYKFASGTANPADPRRSGTFDQLYSANHDKLGHQDLFGWRNIHNPRAQATYGLTKSLAINFMYDNLWLANVKDSLYGLAGRPLVRSPNGTAGRHVGQETDVFGTYKYRHFQFGAGGGHVFSGEFLRKTTPGIGPNYLYIFHTYTL